MSIAQSLSSSAESSGTIQESDVIREDRSFRLKGFSGSLLLGKLLDAQHADRRSTYVHKRAQNRQECRDEVRRANKTTLMKTLLRCYGNELDLLKDFAAKEKEFFGGAAGLTPLVRSSATDRAGLLVDAVGTMLFAMDSGVLTTREELLEAKHNLYNKYRVPLWDSWMVSRADRALTWSAWLLLNIDRLREEEQSDRTELMTARACLVEQETAFRPLLQSAAQDRSTKLAAALTALQECTKKIQGIERMTTGSGTLQ